MKTALIFLAVTILLLVFFWWRVDIWGRGSTIDIHVHDTYYVLTRFSFALFIFLILGTFFSLGGLIGTSFSNKIFQFTFLIFLAIDVYICWDIYHSFHHS